VRVQRLGGKLPLVEVLWIAAQTLATLERAHEQGIIHRDLKPDNLFLTTDQVLKVLDFGVARLRDTTTTETTRTGTVVGTPTFMAPEQAIGSVSEIDARSDIFSLGAIMFRLLTGRHVHVGSQANALVAAATKRAPPILNVDTTIPPDVAKVVDTALQFEREKRYPTAGAMREAIEKVDSTAVATRKSRFTVPRVSQLMKSVPRPGAEGDDVETAIIAARASAEQQALGPAVAPAPPPQPAAPAQPPAAAQPAAAAQAAVPAQPGVSHADSERGLATSMSDDDSIALTDLLRLIGEAVLARDEGGPASVKTIRKVDMAFRRASMALADAHIGLFWNVLPEGFVARGQLVWQATPPLPPTPARMYEAGVRMLGLLPGLTKAEIEDVVRLMGGDLAPFTDYPSFLHEGEHPHVVHRIDATPPGQPEHDSISIEPSSGKGIRAMLGTLQQAEGAALRVTLLGRLERWGEGYEQEIGDVVTTAGVELGMALLRVLHVIDSAAARQAIERATTSPHAIVRIVALAHLDAAERMRTELRATLDAADPRARLEALAAIEKYKVMAAGPALALRIRAPSFDALPVGERRQALTTLGALMPSRAEAIAIELLGDQRLLEQEDHQATREIAAELLGRLGESAEARDALEAATKKRWPSRGNDRIRNAATSALAAFDERARETPARS
jgi:hypothetical protein